MVQLPGSRLAGTVLVAVGVCVVDVGVAKVVVTAGVLVLVAGLVGTGSTQYASPKMRLVQLE